MSRAWFSYNGLTAGALTATNYFYVSFFPQCTTTGENICAILAIYAPIVYRNHPVSFSSNLLSYITTAQANSMAIPTLPDKIFVYVRP